MEAAAAATPADRSGSVKASLRELLVAWLHLGVLWTLAMAQPLLEILADEPAFFVARGNTSGDIVALALAITLLPPTLLAAIEALLMGAPTVRRGVHLVFLGGLGALFVLQLISDAEAPGAAILICAAVAGGVLAVAYRRVLPVRSALTLLSPAPLVLIAWFLLASPVSDLVFPDDFDTDRTAATPHPGDPPIVLIIFDEFFGGALTDTRGRIDSSRYPHFADLARHSTWYRNASTVAGETTTAVPAVLTGLHPEEDELPTAADHPGSIFTLLAGRYEMDVSEPVTAICPSSVCGEEERDTTEDRWRSLVSDISVVSLHTVLPDRLRARLPAVDQTFGNFRGAGRDTAVAGSDVVPDESLESRTAKWDRFLSGLKPDRRTPTLHCFHGLLPHVPWQYVPSGKQYAVGGQEVPGLTEEHWSDQQPLVDTAHQRFLLQLGFVDRQIGGLMKRLRTTGMLRNSLIVVTADHGVSFRAGAPRRQLTLEHPADIANVPLFVKMPGQRRGRVDDSAVRTIDIVPTIADRLGVEPGWGPDGRSFLAGQPRPTDALLKFATLRFSLADLVRSRRQTVREAAARFGQRDGGRGIFAVGPDRDLIGHPAPSTDAARRGVGIHLDQASQLADVDLASPVLPVYFTGVLDGDARPGERLAVAVNGRIWAATRTVSDAGAVAFGTAIPPTSLRQGANSVQLFAIEGTRSERRLVKLGTVRQDDFRLVRRGDEESIRAPHGRAIEIESGAVEGDLDAIDLDAGAVTGWAVDTGAEKAADRVLVFAGDRFLGSAVPMRPRQDLAEPVGPWATNAGFKVAVASAGVSEDDVRVFAVSGGRASEL
jgi:hypothetical protein